jgi:hypothetical protein
VLDLLSDYKAEILRLLRPSLEAWSAEDWRAFFDERAAIAEFEAGLPRPEAEARAFACCIARMAQPQHHAVCARPVPVLRWWRPRRQPVAALRD